MCIHTQDGLVVNVFVLWVYACLSDVGMEPFFLLLLNMEAGVWRLCYEVL